MSVKRKFARNVLRKERILLRRWLISLALLLILLVGCGVNSPGENDDETISKAKDTAESYLIHNYSDIHQIEFDEDSSNPMGGVMVSGIVNGNEKANFSIDIEVENNFYVGSIGKGEEFPERKKECIEKTCDY